MGTMGYRVLADATVVVHFAFLVFVVVGGFLAWRWRILIVPHILAAVWGLSAVTIGIVCPLTVLENWAREQAGIAGLPPSGFIDHYLTGVIYPDSAIGLVRALVLGAVLVSWIGFAAIRIRGRAVPVGR